VEEKAVVSREHRTLGETIDVRAAPTPDLWPISADPSQILDALLNLALNARDAMPQGGRLTLGAANVHLDARAAAAYPDMDRGDYVALSVTDTGVGMPEEVAERATEPFFTTKPPTSGSGLGLSMAYGFAKQSGGHLEIESTVGAGTTIRIFLPRVGDGAVAAPAARQDAPDAPRGSEPVLLVDDNRTLLRIAQRYLVGLGYDVTPAASGPAALAVLQSGQACDLLFTDIVMPDGMNGYDRCAQGHPAAWRVAGGSPKSKD
jgi:CheY-like chemotaxis protein